MTNNRPCRQGDGDLSASMATPAPAPAPTPAQVPELASAVHTRSGSYPLAVTTAQTFFNRLRGLMFTAQLPAMSGLLMHDCTSVHMAFMRYAIDIVYLDERGQVCECISNLRPWRASFSRSALLPSRRSHGKATHTLELPEGTITALDIRPGDHIGHPSLLPARTSAPPASSAPVMSAGRAPAAPRSGAAVSGQRAAQQRQRGAALIEFVVVGPILTLMGLSAIQYGTLFFAKNQINHASFMAARAGSVDNADISKIRQSYIQALAPMYGGGQNAAELAQSTSAAAADVATFSRIEVLNPTKESFDDWSDPKLQERLGLSARIIPNSGIAQKSLSPGASSGQTIGDANIIKLRITHGYESPVPIVRSVYKAYLQWQDTGTDATRTAMIAAGRIPVVSNVTVQMQSDPIEPANPVSSPGPGNNGTPVNAGDPPVVTTDPPDCPLGGCSTQPGGGSAGGGGFCVAPSVTTLSADTLFAFDRSVLQPDGQRQLDALIAKAKALGVEFESLTVSGYTDPIGTADYNQSLSQARAQAVGDYLAAQGLKATTVNVVGMGATDFVKPLSACSGLGDVARNACLAPNRRVVVELKPKN